MNLRKHNCSKKGIKKISVLKYNFRKDLNKRKEFLLVFGNFTFQDCSDLFTETSLNQDFLLG